MKRILALLTAAVMLLTGTAAAAEIGFDGNVVATETAAVCAPYGGNILKAYFRPGSLVNEGDIVAEIGTTRVYAADEGTVCGIFGAEGDSAESITSRYGGVLYIQPVNKYAMTATTEKAYNSSETKFIRVGECVYLCCTKDGSHTGTAIVTSVKEADGTGNTPYTLEVTGGEFYMGETVAIYRSREYAAESCIGRGIIVQNAAIPVAGTGSLLKLHVAVGDTVERGQLLFETVDGVLDGLYAVDSAIISKVSGVVATADAAVGGTVAKGGSLITVYPREAFRIRMSVSEYDLAEIRAGSKVFIEFEWDADRILRYKGEVEEISFLSAGGMDAVGTAAAQYDAYVNFTADENVRLGMSVVVYTTDEATWEAADDMTEISRDDEA